jgi:hypothetical protein
VNGNWLNDTTTNCKVLSILVGLLKSDLELQNEFEKFKDSFGQDYLKTTRIFY